MAALANVMGRPIVSVYPEYAAQTVRRYLNRIFWPFEEFQRANMPLYILWTNVFGVKLEEKEWKPNHFVLLVSRTKVPDSSVLELVVSLEISLTKHFMHNNKLALKFIKKPIICYKKHHFIFLFLILLQNSEKLPSLIWLI